MRQGKKVKKLEKLRKMRKNGKKEGWKLGKIEKKIFEKEGGKCEM